MNFNIKIGKLAVFYGGLVPTFEPMTQHRYVLYVDNTPFFLIRKNDFFIKKKYIEFKIYEPIDPKCYKFILNIISGDKNIGDIEISKLGPLGDVLEQILYSKVKVRKWHINDESLNMKIDNPMDAVKAIELKLKCDNYKVIRN